MKNINETTEQHVCSNCGGEGFTRRWDGVKGVHYNAYYETDKFYSTECKDCDYTSTNDHS